MPGLTRRSRSLSQALQFFPFFFPTSKRLLCHSEFCSSGILLADTQRSAHEVGYVPCLPKGRVTAQLAICWHPYCKARFQSRELWWRIISSWPSYRGCGKGRLRVSFKIYIYFRSPKETNQLPKTHQPHQYRMGTHILLGKMDLPNGRTNRQMLKCPSSFTLPPPPNIHILWPEPQNQKLVLKITGARDHKFRDLWEEHFLFLLFFEAIGFNIIKLFLTMVGEMHLLTIN